MNKILVLEDDEGERRRFAAAEKVFSKREKVEWKVDYVSNIEEVFTCLLDDFDVVVADIQVKDSKVEKLIVSDDGIRGFVVGNCDRLLDIADDAISLRDDNLLPQNFERKQIEPWGECRLFSIEEVDSARMKLAFEAIVGRLICQYIHENYRIPVAVLTGTPGNSPPESLGYKLFTRADDSSESCINSLLKWCKNVIDIGVTRLFGKGGSMEASLADVFWRNVSPKLDEWLKYSSDPSVVEASLQRYIVNHFVDHIEGDMAALPAEVYLFLNEGSDYKTGDIVECGSSGDNYLIMNPLCDMVYDSGKPRADKITLCKIKDLGDFLKRNRRVLSSVKREKDSQEEFDKRKEKAKCFIDNVFRNRSGSQHFLPQVDWYPGGVICFKSIVSCKYKAFNSGYKPLNLRISPSFMKDITARFSANYARQGQPDFDFERLVSDFEQDAYN